MADRQGKFVVVVGPDGVGKTSVARALVDIFPGTTAYVHFRPPVRGALLERPPDHPAPPPEKNAAYGSLRNMPLGWIRILRNFFLFWVGFLATVRPALNAGTLVVVDRWAYGYLAQPRPLKFIGPRVLARAVVRLLPQPDLVANLVAPPDVIHARKAELTREQIIGELQQWSYLKYKMVRDFDSTGSPHAVAQAILEGLKM